MTGSWIWFFIYVLLLIGGAIAFFVTDWALLAIPEVIVAALAIGTWKYIHEKD